MNVSSNTNLSLFPSPIITASPISESSKGSEAFNTSFSNEESIDLEAINAFPKDISCLLSLARVRSTSRCRLIISVSFGTSLLWSLSSISKLSKVTSIGCTMLNIGSLESFLGRFESFVCSEDSCWRSEGISYSIESVCSGTISSITGSVKICCDGFPGWFEWTVNNKDLAFSTSILLKSTLSTSSSISLGFKPFDDFLPNCSNFFAKLAVCLLVDDLLSIYSGFWPSWEPEITCIWVRFLGGRFGVSLLCFPVSPCSFSVFDSTSSLSNPRFNGWISISFVVSTSIDGSWMYSVDFIHSLFSSLGSKSSCRMLWISCEETSPMLWISCEETSSMLWISCEEASPMLWTSCEAILTAFILPFWSAASSLATGTVISFVSISAEFSPSFACSVCSGLSWGSFSIGPSVSITTPVGPTLVVSWSLSTILSCLITESLSFSIGTRTSLGKFALLSAGLRSSSKIVFSFSILLIFCKALRSSFAITLVWKLPRSGVSYEFSWVLYSVSLVFLLSRASNICFASGTFFVSIVLFSLGLFRPNLTSKSADSEEVCVNRDRSCFCVSAGSISVCLCGGLTSSAVFSTIAISSFIPSSFG